MKSKRLFVTVMSIYALFAITVLTLSIKMLFDDSNKTEYKIIEPTAIPVEYLNASKEEEVLLCSSTEIAEEDYIIEVPQITITDDRGIKVWTDPVTVNVTELVNSYNRIVEDNVVWDEKNKLNVLNTLWEFLVIQQGVDPIYASAIMGNVAIEGQFGEEQGTYRILQSIEDARTMTDSWRGYGICQWTFDSRKEDLLTYYEVIYDITGDWQTTLMVAECCMVLEECKALELFDNIYCCYNDDLEHSTGIFAVKYEAYENSHKQWKRVNGEYCLVSSLGSGSDRLIYAQNVYEHFNN